MPSRRRLPCICTVFALFFRKFSRITNCRGISLLVQPSACLLPPRSRLLSLLLCAHFGLRCRFKSVKSIKRITFTREQTLNWWKAINPDEYGFYANVNPAIRHPRWSQASETAYVDAGSQSRIPTAIYNGYGDEVAYMYGQGKEFFY